MTQRLKDYSQTELFSLRRKEGKKKKKEGFYIVETFRFRTKTACQREKGKKMDFSKRVSYMTTGRALPGMMDLGRNAGSNILPTDKCLKLLQEASEENGCIKVEIKDEALVGKKLFRIKVAERPWQEKLDELADKVEEKVPVFFALFRKAKDCLLIKYIPDNAPTKVKFLYTSSTSGLKQSIGMLAEGMRMEEYNVSSPEDLCQDEYFKMKNIEAPLTESEIA